LTAAGAEANGRSGTPAISADGRYVAFSSAASNLVANDGNGLLDVFVRDTQGAATFLVSATSAGASANGISGCDDGYASVACLGISGDGRFISFPSVASDLTAGDSGAFKDVFLRDVISSTTERVSLDYFGQEAQADSNVSALSADGRYVALESEAWLAGVGTKRIWDIFRVDRNPDVPPVDIFPVTDDFSDGNEQGDADWEVAKGKWSVNAAKRYASSGRKENISLFLKAGDDLHGARIRARAQMVSAVRGTQPNAAIIFGYTSPVSFRYVRMRPGKIIIGQVGRVGGERPVLIEKAYPFRTGTFYRITVVVDPDGPVTVYNGARSILEHRFNRIPGGRVGLWVKQGNSLFDDFYVDDAVA
jgi:hypothetical protein